MKQGKRSLYYEGALSDGEKNIRFYGFSENHHKVLFKFKDSGQSVSIANCELKKARDSDQMEILVKDSSAIIESEQYYDVKPLENPDLESVALLADYATITVVGEVQVVEQPMQVSGGLTKQDIILTDGLWMC